MRYLVRIPGEKVSRCLLCAEAVCGKACPREAIRPGKKRVGVEAG